MTKVLSCREMLIRKELLSSKMAWLPLQKTATACFTNELAIACCHLTTHDYSLRPSFYGHSLERIIIHIHIMAFRRDCPPVVRIVNHQIGITAELDSSLLWKYSEEFRRLCAGGVHKAVEV